MLSNIRLSKSLQIYRKNKEVSKNYLEKKLFPNLVKIKTKKERANYLFTPSIKVESAENPGVYYSFMTFKFEEEPSFLENTNETETKYAYLLIIENDEYIFISKKNINGVEKDLKDYINYFEYEKFSCFKGYDNTKYEKVSMGNMTISDAVIRARSYEASNLDGILPMTSSSRSVPRNIKLSNNSDVFSISPNSSRIGQRSSKSSIEEYISWCLIIANEIERQTNDKFIKEFAKPITLKEIITDQSSKPIGILFHFQELEQKIEDGDSLYIDENDSISALDDARVNKLFKRLKNFFNIKFVEDELKYFIFNKKILFSELKVNDKSISIRDTVYNNIYMDNQKEKSLLAYVNDNKNYTVVFDNPKYTYINKYAFADEKLLTTHSINKILSIFKSNHSLLALGDIESEKCKPTKIRNESQSDFDVRMASFNALRRFPSNSLFYRVEEEFKNGVLICDDMGNEWADHINIDNNRIAFIHSKFTKKDSYGASAMHEVVSQALKNIGRVHASIEDYESNYNSKWNDTYQDTNIPRSMKNGLDISNFDDIKVMLEENYSNPNSRRQIYLATPFFRKSQMRTNLQNLVGNINPNPHYIQLIWLLSSFISSCQDYGIEPYILCKD